MSRAIVSLLVSLLHAAPLAAQSGPENGAPAAAPAAGVEITYLANAGYFLRAGDQAVLIDACVRDPISIHAALPGSVHGKLINAKPPFDGPMLVLVSHGHEDHVQPRVLSKLLANNTGAHLATSMQVVQLLQSDAKDFDAIRERIQIVRAVPGTAKRLEGDIPVDFIRLEHSGKGHEKLEHLAHRIELGGLRILHVGDAEAAPVNFAAYHLESSPIDVAIVPYWYLGSEGGAHVLKNQIRARHVIISHVPPNRWDELSEFLSREFPDAILFKDSMEKRTFLPAEAVPAEDPPPSGATGGSAREER